MSASTFAVRAQLEELRPGGTKVPRLQASLHRFTAHSEQSIDPCLSDDSEQDCSDDDADDMTALYAPSASASGQSIGESLDPVRSTARGTKRSVAAVVPFTEPRRAAKCAEAVPAARAVPTPR